VHIEEVDFDASPMSRRSLASAPELDMDDVEELPPRRFAPSGPDVVVVQDDLSAAEDIDGHDAADASAHSRKAVVDAESFRGLRLYSKAIETLRIALEIDPESVEIREKLRDVLSESGDSDSAIGEGISLASIYVDRGDRRKAEVELYRVLESDPNHPTANEMLAELARDGGPADAGNISQYTDEHYDSTTTEIAEPDLYSQTFDGEAPLPSYDLEAVSASAALLEEPRNLRGDFDQADDPFAFGRRGVEEPAPPEEDLDDYLEEPTADALAQGAGFVGASSPNPAPIEGIEEALEEAEFFMLRGLTDDARGILVDALSRSPNHPLLIERLREIDGTVDASQSGTHERAGIEEAPLAPVDDGVFDLAASLDALDELEESTRSSRPPTSLRAVDEIDVDQVFAKFKEGVRAQVSESDSSTHYDLGVAYKEMGLLPDAITEFGLAAKDPRLECTCHAMIGMIHLEQSSLDAAAEAYIRGLGAVQKTIDQEMSLYYDLGTVYEMKASNAEALYYFQKIARRDPGYRDVRDRIDALSPRPTAQTQKGSRALQHDDEFEAAFDELFESK
jgi:tetratricopeptide (TPR) repeat protein